jgi:hypothetical protein
MGSLPGLPEASRYGSRAGSFCSCEGSCHLLCCAKVTPDVRPAGVSADKHAALQGWHTLVGLYRWDLHGHTSSQNTPSHGRYAALICHRRRQIRQQHKLVHTAIANHIKDHLLVQSQSCTITSS